MDAAVGELPDQPRVDGAERELARSGVGPREQPLELRRREVRVRHEPRPGADQLGGQLAAPRGRPPVLPDDRAVDRPPCGALPEQRRLALVRDPDRAQVGRTHARVVHGRIRSLDHGRPDLLRVVLDPAGLREVLSKLAVAAAAHPELLVDDETGRSRRPLVDREDHEASSVPTRPVPSSRSNRVEPRSPALLERVLVDNDLVPTSDGLEPSSPLTAIGNRLRRPRVAVRRSSLAHGPHLGAPPLGQLDTVPERVAAEEARPADDLVGVLRLDAGVFEPAS